MNRGSFLSSTSLAAVAASVPGGSDFVERQANFDAAGFIRAVNKPADIRQVWEAVAFHPAIFNNMKNGLNGLHFGFGYAANRITMAFAPHGPSSAYTYSEYVWQKYRIGEAFGLKDAAGVTVASNSFLKPPAELDKTAGPDDPRSFLQDKSVETLQTRGVVFLTCHTAVEEQAATLVKGGFAPAGMSASDVADDILTHLIPGTHVVPAMIGAIAVLQQQYRYTYITLTFA
jgi:intracellular sulfur oxidation DsrE/DsrF family protein